MIKDTSFDKFFQNKTVFVTGHTGFIGSWLSFWLYSLGANVVGYSSDIPTNPSNFEILNLKNKLKHYVGNINDIKYLQKILLKHQPDIVIHLAAQALVKTSYQFPIDTFQTNVIGTANLLEAVKNTSSVNVCIVMTSDKCYDNREVNYAYKETDPLGGYDPYSASKGAAEIITNSYRNSFFNSTKIDQHHVALSTIRAGNVIGGGDWAKNRLVPDCVKALSKNEEILIRNSKAVRPWQHVLEPISGIFTLIEKMWNDPKNFSQAWNFGPLKSTSVLSVSDLVSKVISNWGNGNCKNILNSPSEHESNLLMLDSTKASENLQWTPTFSIDQAISETIIWYKKYFDSSEDMVDFTLKQILKYVQNRKK